MYQKDAGDAGDVEIGVLLSLFDSGASSSVYTTVQVVSPAT